MMRLWELEQALGEVRSFEHSKVELEQYNTSAHLASQLIYSVQQTFDDIRDKYVCDLGCGTGMLCIAAALSGAAAVLGVDVDQDALQIARQNVRDLEVEHCVDLLCADVVQPFDGETWKAFDTVVMNAPFGTKRKGVDVAFVQRALQICDGSVYSMHKSSTRAHLRKTFAQWGTQASVMAELRFDIGRTMRFHQRDSVDVQVDVWRLSSPAVAQGMAMSSLPRHRARAGASGSGSGSTSTFGSTRTGDAPRRRRTHEKRTKKR
eukprot:TRINITY_DN436_c0_g1_i2.p3 TRINITY_DN436_c0_g1~~TRINITY_DN436_c0_g1_i2.p3  ORF type:complete len:263 (+),score=54.63 TRINITY_DN436_c0_g1_i2:7497-8285(+)